MTRTGEEMCKEGSPWKYSKRKFLCVFNKKVTAYFEIEKELAFDEKMLPAAKKKKIEMGKDLVNQVGVRSISRSNPTTKTPDQNNSNQTTFVFFPSSQKRMGGESRSIIGGGEDHLQDFQRPSIIEKAMQLPASNRSLPAPKNSRLRSSFTR